MKGRGTKLRQIFKKVNLFFALWILLEAEMSGFAALKLQTIFATSESCVAFYITEERMKFMQRRFKNTKSISSKTCDRN